MSATPASRGNNCLKSRHDALRPGNDDTLMRGRATSLISRSQNIQRSSSDHLSLSRQKNRHYDPSPFFSALDPFSISLKPPSKSKPDQMFRDRQLRSQGTDYRSFCSPRISPSSSNLLQNQNPIKCFEIDSCCPKALITGHFVPTRISPSLSNLLQNQNPIKCFEIDSCFPKALITGHFVPRAFLHLSQTSFKIKTRSNVSRSTVASPRH